MKKAPGKVSSPRPRTSRRALATRESLLEAASRLFAERGFHATSVPEIVKAAGVGHGTFYQYFGSRREILLALAEQAHSAASKRPKLAGHSLADQIRADIYWYLLESVQHKDLWKIWHDAAMFDDEIAAMLRQARAHRSEQVRDRIEAVGIRSGLDPAVAATALTAMIEEFTYRWFIEGEGPGTSNADIVTASETLSSIFLAAIS